ncbi:MAG: 7TM diverse intracellular signaling domain-containing protein [Salinivirgaceae bacterium]
MKMKLRIQLWILSLFVGLCYGAQAQSDSITISLFDFSNESFQSQPIKLQGPVYFYWQALLEPEALEQGIVSGQQLVAQLPGPWTKITGPDGNKLPAQGYGTYSFTLRVPNANQVYGLKLYSIFTAYRLYANGDEVAAVGEVGKTAESSVPRFLTNEISLPVLKKGDAPWQNIDLVLQVSNFHHRRAGAQQPMYFSTMHNILCSSKDSFILNLLLIGIILIIGFNHLLMYFLRRSDVSNLMFGMLSMVMILRNISTGDRLLTYWFPGMNWELLVKLDNFSGFATITLFAYYFYFIFRREFPKFMFYLIMALGVIITLLVFGTPAWFYGQFRMLFEVYIGLGGLYLTFGVLLPAAFKKRTGGLITFIGMLVLYVTAISDVLVSMGLLQIAYVAPYGIAVFMLLQSYQLTRRSASALKNNQLLAGELEREKQNLESNIEKRTQELQRQAQELQKYRDEQEKQNFVTTNLNQISGVMHQHKDDFNVLADKLLATLIKAVNGHLGALYLYENENNHECLRLLAHYGLSAEAAVEELGVNEGITGKCFSSGKAIYMESLPDKYFSISSGLGSAAPKDLALLPLINDQKVIGVVEIASFKPLELWHRDFLTQALVSIAAQLQIVQLNSTSQKVLADYKSYQEELERKEAEFRELQQELAVLREAAQSN